MTSYGSGATVYRSGLSARLASVIKEARRRARRRRLVLAAVFLVAAASVVVFALQASSRPGPQLGIAQLSRQASTGTGCSPGPRPAIGKMPGDANGDGKITDSGNERIPALVAAVGDQGVAGYVKYTDVFCTPAPASPTAALAAQGQTQVIAVYAPDGTTVVDTLTIKPASSASVHVTVAPPLSHPSLP